MTDPQPPSWLHRFAVLTACATFLLIIAGALVVGHDAGLAVPDWPLSYGTLFPKMEGNIFYEHGHRMIAGLVATLTIVLAVLLWRAERRPWVRSLGIVAVLAVVLQAVLGGLTVLYLLPTPVVVGHACLAQIFFCITLSLAVVTSRAWNVPGTTAEDAGFPNFRHIAVAATTAVFIQLILGAARRHHALGIAPHMAWAAVVMILVLYTAFAGAGRFGASQPILRNLSVLAMLLVGGQIVLGFESYFTRLSSDQAPQPEDPMILATTAHVAVGALLLGTMLVITLFAYRKLSSPGKAISFSENPQKTLA